MVPPQAENKVSQRLRTGTTRAKIRRQQVREHEASGNLNHAAASQRRILIHRTPNPNTTMRNRIENRRSPDHKPGETIRVTEPEDPESVGIRPAAPDTKPKTEALTRPIGGNLRDGLGAISSAGCACLSAQTNGSQAQRQRPRGLCPEVRSILVGKCTQNVHILGCLGKGVSSCTF
jgi:hypothetical protein